MCKHTVFDHADVACMPLCLYAEKDPEVYNGLEIALTYIKCPRKGVGSMLFRKKTSRKEKERARSLHGYAVKYVSERIDGIEHILGEGGAISVRDDEFIVLSSNRVVFRAPIEHLEISDLLSGNGSVLTYRPPKGRGDMKRITIFYVEDRK